MGRLWLRWSVRDLRARWMQVAAIALIIGLGCGLYAGLGATATWRKLSNDASFAALHLHDLRVQVEADVFVPQGSLTQAIAHMAHPEWIAAAEERLSVATQLDAGGGDNSALLPGQLVGQAVDARIDQLHVVKGTLDSSTPTAHPVVVLERNMAKQYALAETGTATLAGGVTVDWVGHAIAPEWFVVTDPRGGYLAGVSYAVVFTSLVNAQQITGHEGEVNDMVLTVAPGVSVPVAQSELRAALDALSLSGATKVTTRDDVAAHHLLYSDAEGDQKVWNAVSIIVLLGAAFAASNLVNRMIESQRRELGIGMALGVSPRRLVTRPLLVGVEIGVLGALLGVLVGLGLNATFRSVLGSVLPLPVWRTPFQVAMFVRGALLGLAVSVLAVLWPVYRATRMSPIEALSRVRPTTSRTGFDALARRLRLRGPSIRLLPLRDLVRAPRRTLFTAFGIAASISVLVGVLGMMDSFLHVVTRAETEAAGEGDPVTVDLDRVTASSDPIVTALTQLPEVSTAEQLLLLPGQLSHGARSISAVLQMGDLAHASWAPSLSSGRLPGLGEVLMSDKALADLDLEVGDSVDVTHVALVDGAMATVTSPLLVSGIDGNPLRAFVYLDTVTQDSFGLSGMVNQLQLQPSAGTTSTKLQRVAFIADGVASARSARATSRAIRDSIDSYLGLLRVVEAIPILLALLVAFNATAIGVDERRRDHATMFAFGLPVSRVLRLLMAESFVLGVLGTGLGVLAGIGLARWVVESVVPETLPELSLTTYLSPTSLIVAAGLGVFAVAIAPLFVLRRLRRLDVPGSLRIVE
ncbi:MAG: ABC transporter permease [Acidimicrobiia bacterium]